MEVCKMTIAKKYLQAGLAFGVFTLCTGSATTLWADGHQKEFVISLFDVPGWSGSISPQGITSTGIILGCYHDLDVMDSMHGFARASDGSFSGFSVPVSMHTGATPDASRIVGLYGGAHSYVIDRGDLLSFDVPDSTLTY